ncbi:hypothetical protein WN51_03059 [Melipona quadrifasciata]|uniref:Uncharacterized protein n=1 Tax=Melipona quadrifasciata TaxID=166423 RepID=A0A0M8ZWT2_9HYME|nr:hypothetical protein WN51_03059 [Melipona quadrifasciata]
MTLIIFLVRYGILICVIRKFCAKFQHRTSCKCLLRCISHSLPITQHKLEQCALISLLLAENNVTTKANLTDARISYSKFTPDARSRSFRIYLPGIPLFACKCPKSKQIIVPIGVFSRASRPRRQPWLLENEIRESQYCPDSARLGRVHNNGGFRIGLKRLIGAEWLRTDYTPQKGRKGLFAGNLFTLRQVLDTDKNSFRDKKEKKKQN